MAHSPAHILKWHDLDSLQAAFGWFLPVQGAIEAQGRSDPLAPYKLGIKSIEVVPYRYFVGDPVHIRTRVRSCQGWLPPSSPVPTRLTLPLFYYRSAAGTIGGAAAYRPWHRRPPASSAAFPTGRDPPRGCPVGVGEFPFRLNRVASWRRRVIRGLTPPARGSCSSFPLPPSAFPLPFSPAAKPVSFAGGKNPLFRSYC